MSKIIYRAVRETDEEWIDQFIQKHWSSEKVVVHNTVYYPRELKGIIAEDKKGRTGLITYNLENENCEIVTLNSISENKGVGTSLVNLVIAEAQKKKCRTVWLITTNDNIKAMHFYQKLGFKLVKIYPDAVKESRKLKPEIPLHEENGTPLRDELEFSLDIKEG
jgi:N-acetylglutamate synthase-like GNAT family acetyltransferase